MPHVYDGDLVCFAYVSPVPSISFVLTIVGLVSDSGDMYAIFIFMTQTGNRGRGSHHVPTLSPRF